MRIRQVGKVFLLFINDLRSLETALIFSSFPSAHLSHVSGAGDQVLGSALLAVSILMVTDRRNMVSGGGGAKTGVMMPGVLGLTVLGLGVSLGFNCGYPLNPARDLAPRLLMGNLS